MSDHEIIFTQEELYELKIAIRERIAKLTYRVQFADKESIKDLESALMRIEMELK